ncbi:MAG: VCBS repeat-containing protein [Planctomycetota bacterium]
MRWAALAPFVCAAALHGQSLDFHADYVQLEGRRAGDILFEDIDGDGRRDLLVATEGDDGVTRRIELFLRHADGSGFSTAPDRSIDVPRDVVAFALADLDPEPGRELVLCSASIAVGMHLCGDGGARPFRIANIELLWQPANLPHTYLLADCVADLDHDGHDDLLIPEPKGYRALLQRRDADGKLACLSFELVTPTPPPDATDKSQARLRAQAGSLQIRVRDKDRARLAAVVEIEDSVPIPALCDFDGDGDLDVVALIDHLLCVWPWNDGYAREPSLRFTVKDSGSSLLNPSRSVQVADLDGDHRFDLLAVTGRAQGDDIESRVEVYLQQPDGHFPDKPTDRLLLRGFVDIPRVCDIDGDGLPELVIGSLRTDVLGALANGGSSNLEAQLNVFRNEFRGNRPRFARPVSLAERILLPTDVMRGRFRDRMLATWLFDADGDGVRDFLQRTDAEKLQIRRTMRTDSGFELGVALWQTTIDKRARVLPFVDGGRLAMLVVEGTQVIHLEQR